MESPILLIACTRPTIRNIGSSPQKPAVGVRSSPGNRLSGIPTQGDATRCSKSYSPNGTAATHPAAIPISSDQGRQIRGARSINIVVTTNVTAATHGPAAKVAPSGTSFIRSKAMGRTMAAISMSTVPETTGVMMRRSRGSQAANAR